MSEDRFPRYVAPEVLEMMLCESSICEDSGNTEDYDISDYYNW